MKRNKRRQMTASFLRVCLILVLSGGLSKASVAIGKAQTLSYTLSPSDASTTVTWKSDAPDIAEVSSSGKIKEKKEGEAKITATTDNGRKASCVLTVPEPIYQLFVWMKSGEKTGYLFSDHPQFALNGNVVNFKTDNETMEIAIEDLDKFTLEQVLPEHPTDILLPDEMKVGLNRTARIRYTLIPADAETTITWFNSNPEIVSISQDGMLRGLKLGTATLTAQTSNGLRATCQVVVPEPQWRFYVWLRSGEYSSYDIKEYPEVTFGTKVFKLSTTRTTTEYAAKDVLRFTLNDVAVENPATGIEVIEEDRKQETTFNEGMLSVLGLSPGSIVSVYNMSGSMVMTSKADNSGKVFLSLAILPSGIYIVKTEKTTYKYYKK